METANDTVARVHPTSRSGLSAPQARIECPGGPGGSRTSPPRRSTHNAPARASFSRSPSEASSSCAPWLGTALAPSPPALLEGDPKQVGQPPLRVRPRGRTQLAEHLALSAGPERARGLEGSSPLGCQRHRLDAAVGMRNTLDRTIPLQELEASRQRRLVDGERVLELPQIRLAQTCDGAENAELSHP